MEKIKKLSKNYSIIEAGKYAAEDADMTLRLWKIFKSSLVQDKQVKIYEIIEKPLAQSHNEYGETWNINR